MKGGQYTPGARPTYDADELLTIRLDEASATLSYYGRADAGALTNAAVWQIKRIDTSAGMVVDWAGGSSPTLPAVMHAIGSRGLCLMHKINDKVYIEV